MSEQLENGAVLPTGLLGQNLGAMMEGYNKTYKNFPLRVGVVIASYPPSDTRNRSKLAIEYDVSVIEQNADIGATNIVYKNCMSSEGLGSIADYFEMSLRYLQKKTTKGDAINTTGQDGAVVLLLCLDGMSDKAIIITSLTHPDRTSNLTDSGPLLAGEYNGVKVMVNEDGSTSLTFNGATDNQGKPLDASQGTTSFSIQKDGSFEFKHDAVDIAASRAGKLSITTKTDCSIAAQGDMSVTCKNANVTSSGDTNVTATGNVNVKGSKISLNGSASGVTTANSHQGVIDLITGVPVQPSKTTSSDV